jgi:hypothetical protein
MSLGAEIRTYPSNGIKTNCAIDISSFFYLMISRSSLGSGDRADFIALTVAIVRGLDEPPRDHYYLYHETSRDHFKSSSKMVFE